MDVSGDLYRKILKKMLFRVDPENVHNIFVSFGKGIGSNPLGRKLMRKIYDYENPALRQNILGIHFRNPVCLSAGFDYNANLTQILPDLGFGAMSIGSITYGAYEGNKRPRLGRLPKSRSLMVNKGLKNIGTERIINKLKGMKFRIPVGISVAKTNSKTSATDEGGIEDYVKSFEMLKKSRIGDYYELNISCPNAFGGEPFTTPKRLKSLLKEIDKINLKKPLFIKMPIDLTLKETDELCKVAKLHNVEGLIFGNLTKDKNNPSFDREEVRKWKVGAFSGKPTEKKSNERIAFAYKKYGKRFVIIGCGGVFSAEDAYEKIKLGASFIQLITGMIYEGPGVIGDINRGLVKLLKKDGFKSLKDAVGTGIKN